MKHSFSEKPCSFYNYHVLHAQEMLECCFLSRADLYIYVPCIVLLKAIQTNVNICVSYAFISKTNVNTALAM